MRTILDKVDEYVLWSANAHEACVAARAQYRTLQEMSPELRKEAGWELPLADYMTVITLLEVYMAIGE